MKLPAFVVFILVMLTVSLWPGDLQITCPSGFEVYIDNVRKGITDEEFGGLIVTDLSTGKHVVVLRKSGFKDARYEIIVSDQKTAELVIEIGDRTSSENIGPTTNKFIVEKSTGSLHLRSLPLYSKVFLNNQEIGTTDLRVNDFDAGPLNVKFQYKDKTLQGTFVLAEGDYLTLKADFVKEKIEQSSLIDRYKDKSQLEIVIRANWQSCREGTRGTVWDQNCGYSVYGSEGIVDVNIEGGSGKTQTLVLAGSPDLHKNPGWANQRAFAKQVLRKNGESDSTSFVIADAPASLSVKVTAKAVIVWSRKNGDTCYQGSDEIWKAESNQAISTTSAKKTVVYIELNQEHVSISSALKELSNVEP